MKKKSANPRRKLLLGLGASSAAAVWHKPLTNAIVLPAHAQMSMCPMVTLANVVSGPVSGSTVPPVCQVTFDVLSATAGMDLNITAITNSALPANTTVTVDTLGTATDTTGPRVVWRGPAAEAPFCIPVTPINDITFTIQATCAIVGGGAFSQDFTLLSLL